MKKMFFSFIVIVVSLSLHAQELNLAGSWKLNAEKSRLNAEFSFAPKEIIITQDGNNLTIEKHSTFQDQDYVSTDKLTLDGKECVNAGLMDTQKRSTCTWSDDKASLKIGSKMSIGDGDLTMTEVYKMDGGTMIIEFSASSSYGDMSETQAYDRK